MGTNIKGLLAGIILLIGFGGFSTYGYIVQHEHAAVTWAIIVGVLLAGVDWAVRKPGRGPNKKVIGIAYVVGILGGPLVHLVWGERTQFSIAVYVSSLCLPLVAYILLITWIYASKSPGFWRR